MNPVRPQEAYRAYLNVKASAELQTLTKVRKLSEV